MVQLFLRSQSIRCQYTLHVCTYLCMYSYASIYVCVYVVPCGQTDMMNLSGLSQFCTSTYIDAIQ